ncbi:MAG: T9SS type A sorting domain-containing protein [Cytophagales bacterium]
MEIEYAGGCKPYSDSLLVDLDTVICDSGFVISPNNFICTSDPVAMINRGTKNDSITYTWNFPGGLPSSYTGYYPPLVKYSSSGNYTITLIMSSTVSIDTFTKNISVSESCCDHDYSADSTVTFKNAALGFKDSITTYTGGGTFSGTYNVLGTIVLEDGIYTIEDGSNFFVDAACINCDYITQLEEICRNFTYDDKTQIILVGATLNMGDAEFRSSCDSMWYGIAAFQGSTISSLNDTSGQNALIMDAMAGISICDWPFEYEDNYYLDQVSFLNNIISMNDRDRSSNFNFIRNSHIDTDKDLMKAPYGNRYGLAGINLSGGHYYADFDNNFIANQLYGYYHRLIGDPGNTYHIKNNTLRDFYIVGMAIGGRNLTVNSEIINNDFYFTKSHIGSQSSPISAYSGYEGIPIYNTGVFGETGAAPVENEICGVYASGRLHCYGNRFFGFDSLLAPHVQSGITLTTLQGNVPNDVSFRENTFNDLGIGVRYMHASKEISENTFNNNKKAIRITNLSIHFDCLLDQNTFFENNMAIEVDNNTTITSTYELSLQENLFLDNDTAISVLYDNDTISLSMLMNCNKFQLDNTESYTRYGLFVHDSADIASVGGDNSLSDPNDPSGNGWPVDPSSTGYDSCITPGVGIDVTQWSSPSNWVSIEDNSTSTWKYFAYNNEFTGLFNPSGILDRQDPGVDAPSCAVQDICFPLARIMATLDIDENSKELVIYPNPSKEMIQIRSAGEKTIELIRIYDIALSKSPIELYLTGKRIEMNISVLTSGLYFLEVWNKDGSRDFARLIKK